MPNENQFPEWLRQALNGRPNVFLVRNSGVKENGRPVIDDSRVSKWLKGDQRPSMELAALAARVLGGSQAKALSAAGYAYGHSLESIERMEAEYPTPTAKPETFWLRTVPSPDFDRLVELHEEMGRLLESIASGEANERQDERRRAAAEAEAARTHIKRKEGEERADSSPTTKTPDVDPADQSTNVTDLPARRGPRLQDRAARHVGREGSAGKARREQDEQVDRDLVDDDPNDMEPR